MLPFQHCPKCGHDHGKDTYQCERCLYEIIEIECTGCGTNLPAGAERCGVCGWDYTGPQEEGEPTPVVNGVYPNGMTPCPECRGSFDGKLNKCVNCGYIPNTVVCDICGHRTSEYKDLCDHCHCSIV